MIRWAYIVFFVIVVKIFDYVSGIGISDAYIDPCTLDNAIPYEHLRYSFYSADSTGGEPFLCDNDLLNAGGDWYKTRAMMLDSSPGLNACGTLYPIWQNGTRLDDGNNVWTIQACVQTENDTCEEGHSVKMKKCPGFYAYFLQQPSLCPAAHCFGLGQNDSKPELKRGRPRIRPYLQKRVKRMAYQILAFSCEFNLVNQSLYAQIHWFVGGKQVSISRNVHMDDINSTHLTEDDGSFTSLGIEVSCAVRLKNFPDGRASQMSKKSDAYFAGVKVLNPVVVATSDSAVIYIQTTVPIGCVYQRSDDLKPNLCSLNAEVMTPRNSSLCVNSSKSFNSLQLCGVSISSELWMKPGLIKVLLDNDYLGSRSENDKFLLFIRILPTITSSLWKGHPDLKVIIWPDRRTSSCRTFVYSSKYPNTLTGYFNLYSQNVNNGVLKIEAKVCGRSNILHRWWAGVNKYISVICGLAFRHGPALLTMTIGDGNELDIRQIGNQSLITYSVFKSNTTVIFHEAAIYANVMVTGPDIFNLSSLLCKVEIPLYSKYQFDSTGICANQLHEKIIRSSDLLQPTNRVTKGKDLFSMTSRTLHETSVPSILRKSISFCTCPSSKTSSQLYTYTSEVQCSYQSRNSC